MEELKIIDNKDEQLKQVSKVQDLAIKAAETIKGAQSKNTVRAYKADLKAFNKFCLERLDFVFLDDNELSIQTPINDEQLFLYIAHLENFVDENGDVKPYKHSSITRKVASISKIHKLQGFISPRSEIIKDYLTAIKVKQSGQGLTTKQAKAITINILETIIKGIDLTTNRGQRDKAIILLCFVGCLRRSEIASLCLENGENVSGFVEHDSDGLFIHFNQTKSAKTTDETQSRFVPFASNPLLCPVRALNAWLETFDCISHLFVTIDRHDNIDNASPIVGDTVNRIIKKYFGKDFSGHSLRVGSAVTARLNGADMESIRIMGGWKTDVMPRRYTKQTDIKKNTAAFKLGL